MYRSNNNLKESLFNHLFLLILLIVNIFTTGSISYIVLCTIYCIVYFNIIFNLKNTPIFTLFILGILLDSINNIFFGLSSFFFIISILIIKVENHFLHIKDMLTTYISFILNISIFAIILIIISLIIQNDIFIIIKTLTTCIIIFPFMYYLLNTLYKYLYNNDEK